MNEQAEQLGELQDNFKETSETKEKLQEALTAAETDLREKQGLIVEKDAQITTFNIKVHGFFLHYILHYSTYIEKLLIDVHLFANLVLIYLRLQIWKRSWAVSANNRNQPMTKSMVFYNKRRLQWRKSIPRFVVIENSMKNVNKYLWPLYPKRQWHQSEMTLLSFSAFINL